mmetsp:Transcript_18898/g.36052  ORF Transcript_18898/g.36052 Transcript_18898/m.36052 type:complete len:376 (-) Transcript_18898:1290-2417(-)
MQDPVQALAHVAADVVRGDALLQPSRMELDVGGGWHDEVTPQGDLVSQPRARLLVRLPCQFLRHLLHGGQEARHRAQGVHPPQVLQHQTLARHRLQKRGGEHDGQHTRVLQRLGHELPQHSEAGKRFLSTRGVARVQHRGEQAAAVHHQPRLAALLALLLPRRVAHLPHHNFLVLVPALQLGRHESVPLGGDPWAKAHLALEANLQDLLLGALRHVRHHDARCQLQRRVAPHHHPVLRQAGLRFLRARRGLGTLGSVPTCLPDGVHRASRSKAHAAKQVLARRQRRQLREASADLRAPLWQQPARHRQRVLQSLEQLLPKRGVGPHADARAAAAASFPVPVLVHSLAPPLGAGGGAQQQKQIQQDLHLRARLGTR